MKSLSLKELTQFMAMVADENTLTNEQAQWIYHKLNIISYVMKRDKKETMSQDEFKKIIASKNNFEIIGNCPLNFVNVSAKDLNESLTSIEPIQMQMENILLGEWNQYANWNKLIDFEKKKESFSLAHMNTLLKYTFWVAFVATLGLMFFDNASTITLIKTTVMFASIWIGKKIFFDLKDRLAEKKITNALSLKNAPKEENVNIDNSRYGKLLINQKEDLNPVNWTSNEKVNNEIALLKNQSLRLAMLMDKKKTTELDYAEEWYNVQSMWKNHIPRLVDMCGENERNIQSVMLTVISMQKVLQSHIDEILEEDLKELSLKQKFWATKASTMSANAH